MGLFTWLRGDAPLRFGLGDPANYEANALVTPFAGDRELASISVPDDVFGANPVSVTRAEAMSIPTWSLARRRVCGLSRFPLVTYRGNLATRGGEPVPDQPRWLGWSAYYPPRLRMLWTIDDIAHHGWSLWTLDLGAANDSGRRTILDAGRIAYDRWDFVQTVDGVKIRVKAPGGSDSRILDDDEYILFPGSNEGLLKTAAGTIRGARDLEQQWTSRVKNPLPLVELRYTGDEDLEPDEMKDVRKVYIEARTDPDGIVMVTPRGWEVHAPEVKDVQMFTEGRNAAALDIARSWGMSASMLDASQINGSSVDYENNGIGRSEFYDLTWRDWALPIEERLSMDDVCPAGSYVAFDFSSVTTPDTGTGPVLED